MLTKLKQFAKAHNLCLLIALQPTQTGFDFFLVIALQTTKTALDNLLFSLQTYNELKQSGILFHVLIALHTAHTHSLVCWFLALTALQLARTIVQV